MTAQKKAEAQAEAKETPSPAAEAPTVDILLLKDYWDENGVRQKAEQTINVPVKQAKRLINEGKAVRADPWPGEDA